MTNYKKYNITKYLIVGIVTIIYIVNLIIVATKTFEPKGTSFSANIAVQLAGIFVTFLPLLFEWIFKLRYTILAWIIYTLFCLLSMGIGTGLGVYNIFSAYDFILHFSSGLLVAFLTYAIFSKCINKDVSLSKKLFYTFLFAVCFSVFVGVVWEIWEFSMDHFFGLNCQRFAEVEGAPYVGHKAVIDTMLDLIADTSGAIVTSASFSIYYFVKKKEPKNLFTFKPNISKTKREEIVEDNNNNTIEKEI